MKAQHVETEQTHHSVTVEFSIPRNNQIHMVDNGDSVSIAINMPLAFGANQLFNPDAIKELLESGVPDETIDVMAHAALQELHKFHAMQLLLQYMV